MMLMLTPGGRPLNLSCRPLLLNGVIGFFPVFSDQFGKSNVEVRESANHGRWREVRLRPVYFFRWQYPWTIILELIAGLLDGTGIGLEDGRYTALPPVDAPLFTSAKEDFFGVPLGQYKAFAIALSEHFDSLIDLSNWHFPSRIKPITGFTWATFALSGSICGIQRL